MSEEDKGVSWLEEEFSSEMKAKEKKEEPKAEEPEVEPVVEEKVEEKVAEVKSSKDAGAKIVEHLMWRLVDKEFIMSENMNASTCKRIHDIMNLLVENDGEWIEGRKTMNGFVTQCPIYNFAPMYMCFKCEHWKGGKNPEGVCMKSLEDLDHTTPKYMQAEATDMEIRDRQERGSRDEEE